jgi:hypothetical protein
MKKDNFIEKLSTEKSSDYPLSLRVDGNGKINSYF